MNVAEPITLTPDSFLAALGLGDLEKRLRSAEERQALFELTIEYLKENGQGSTASLPTSTSSSELQLKVPGVALVVRLNAPTREELVALIALAYFVFGTGGIDVRSVALAGLTGLLARMRRLRAQYGERSIIEALADLHRPTAGQITLALFGRPCRFPDADCRFMEGSSLRCAISNEDVTKIATDLVTRGLLRRLNAVEPYEFGVGI